MLATKESEEDLRKLEKMWENFITTGTISLIKIDRSNLYN